ncbi:cytochrome P450 [Salinibacterium sp. SWN1162]|uniref:cytochrome P450 n=1 Tax=Salinibacterium sp. SWN1162 TaxID=2792053 RepID=UPI0018CF5AC7|nr:cytochrome P450 [Salinibacterium sp. SWN1162]MBH0007790.1 cytochrome P450 [Salinibacterium sp. SWN1162]
MTTTPAAAAGVCPFTGRSSALPLDGNPHVPTPALAEFRENGPATPIRFADDHEGLLVTQFGMAQAVLEDPRFTQNPRRFLLGPPEGEVHDVDQRAKDALAVADILSLDGDQHRRIRRSVTARFSVKAARGRREAVRGFVTETLDAFLAGPNPGNVTTDLATPISVRSHCLVLGVPDSHVQLFGDTFAKPTTTQRKFDVIRELLELVRLSPGDNVFSDLIASDLTAAEVEGLAWVLSVSGRDSVAYMISMSVLTLLKHPEQWELLKREPELLPGAIEELVRYNTMFLTVFSRTALEDMEIQGVTIPKGQSVTVSPVGANRDPERFDDPSTFDITRDSAGHLGFSHGPHGCVGQQFARVQITEALTQLLTRVPDLTLIDAEFESPYPLASYLPTYEAPPVNVTW